MRLLLASVVSILGFGLVAACSSGSGTAPDASGGAAGKSTGGSGGSSGSGASGGSGGAAGGGCLPECFASTQCVHACGEAPTDYGCCACPTGMIDVLQCAQDAGCNPVVPNPGTISCGSTQCTATQICVQPCCGGADAGACSPEPPYCVEAASVSCLQCSGGASSSCSAPQSCSGILSGQTLACMCA